MSQILYVIFKQVNDFQVPKYFTVNAYAIFKLIKLPWPGNSKVTMRPTATYFPLCLKCQSLKQRLVET